MKNSIFPLLLIAAMFTAMKSWGCTGITLRSAQNETVTARTIEWAGEPLNSYYVIVPQGHRQQSYLPDGQQEGLVFRAKYGYVGLAVEQPEFIMDGINEAGLAAGLFYFPSYGEYEPYESAWKYQSISDFQLVAWMLSCCSTIAEVEAGMRQIHVIGIDPRSSTVHWRVTEPNGRQVVIEITDGEVHFYDNPLGVLTNAPDLPWHLKNLNNYVNLQQGSAPPKSLGPLMLRAFGGGSGMIGLPGDMTPPSRFVRAAMYQSTAPVLADAQATVFQALHLLNNFDIPIGLQTAHGAPVPNQPSATQWTVATDLSHRCIYYRTMYDATIRRIDLNRIDFRKVSYQSGPLDKQKRERVVDLVFGNDGESVANR